MKKTSLLLIGLLLLGCAPKEKKLYNDSTMQAGFDTVISIQLYADSQEEFDETFQKATDAFLYYNSLFDKYNDYDVANIKTINDNAGIQPVEVSQVIIDMLLLSKQYSELSNYQFDVTLGPVLSLWHDVREKALNGDDYTLPTEEQLQSARACSGWDKVEIDDENNTVYLNQSCASLDVGAVAKGYATQLVTEMLLEEGYVNGFVNAGGNVEFIGNKINGDLWRAGILTPSLHNSTESLITLELGGQEAFVTSGDYQRYFIHDGNIMHHIIDPDTLYPARHAKSVTILCEDSGIADILSTTLYTMTYQEGAAYLEKLKENGIEAEAIWIYDKTDEIENENYREKEGYYILTTPNIASKIIN